MDQQIQGLFNAETGDIQSVDDFYSMIKDESWCAYMGSGVAASVLGSWRDLVSDLCKKCKAPFNPNDLENEDQLLELADRAWEYSSTEFCKFLYDKLGPINPGGSNVYSWIMRLPFKAYLTTNYDDGLRSVNGVGKSRSKVFVYPNISPTDISLGQIFYLHGKIDSAEFDNESIILGAKSFKKGYNDTSPLNDVIRNLLLYENIIVFGARLKEPPLSKLIQKIYDLSVIREEEHKISPKKKIIIIPGIHPKKGGAINRTENPEMYKKYQDFILEVKSFREVGFSVYSYETNNNDAHKDFNIFLNSLNRVHESIQTWEIK